MVDWVPDKSLVVLVKQVDVAAPNRSKASDGLIGDASHASRDSDHNAEDTTDADAPGNPDHQVDAADITHDPAHGADMGIVTEAVRRSRDPRVKYVIFNRRIFSGTLEARRAGLPAYTWGPYHGTDPHTGHAHVSVEDVTHDQTQPWAIGIGDTMALTDKQYAELDQRTEANDRRLRALTTGETTPYAVTWTAGPDDKEIMTAAVQLATILKTVTTIATTMTEIKNMIAAIPIGGAGTTGALTAARLAASLEAQVEKLTAP